MERYANAKQEEKIEEKIKQLLEKGWQVSTMLWAGQKLIIVNGYTYTIESFIEKFNIEKVVL